MSSRSRVLWAWAWVAACVTVILTFSGEGFSGDQTSRFLYPFLRWIHPEISAKTIWKIHFYIRKSAHLFEYALLAVLAFRAFRLTIDVSLLRVAGLVLLIVLAVAGVDEWRQSFLPTRSGSLGDIAINLTGGSVGVLLVVALHRLFGVRAPEPREGS